MEQPGVLDSRDRVEDVDDPLAFGFQHLQVVAEELDRVGPLDARKRLLDVVADQLREVEVDRRERLELLGQLILDLLPGDRPIPELVAQERHRVFRHSSIGISGALNSRLK